MNHEFPFATLVASRSSGVPKNRGAIVSKWILDSERRSRSRASARTTRSSRRTRSSAPAPVVGNATRPFSRFCSGSLAGRRKASTAGSTSRTRRKATPANTFDGKGGQTVAIVDINAIYAPAEARPLRVGELARAAERGPSHGDHEHGGWAYALDRASRTARSTCTWAQRIGSSGADVLRPERARQRRALRARPRRTSKSSEAAFSSGTIPVEWVADPRRRRARRGPTRSGERRRRRDSVSPGPRTAHSTSDNRNEFFFVTTGERSRRERARPPLLARAASRATYEGRRRCRSTTAADAIIAAGGDIAISPDNIDTSEEYLMINEDGTTSSRPVMATKGRDGSIWRFDLERNRHRRLVAPLGSPSSTRQVVMGSRSDPDVWETSGIIDARPVRREHVDLRRPGPRADHRAGRQQVTVEDGQLFLLQTHD